MKDINILVLSAGRRVELIERFQSAKKQLGINGKIIAVDISDTAPAIYFADKYYLIPRVDDDKYISSIVDICNNENIHIVIPTIDTELLKLSENKEYIENKANTKILISSDKVIKICRNKYHTQKFFEENNFLVPRLISFDDINKKQYDFPLFIKPIDGSSSINAFKVNNDEELQFFIKYVKNPIVQEFISGDELSIDIFCDFESNPITIVPRRRLLTRGGEISKGQIIKDVEVINDAKRLINVLKPIGHITIQCIKTNRGIEYIEINPRFGGGAPMSIDAGADSCKNIYKLLLGEKLSYNENYASNAIFVRFDKSIRIDK